MRIFSRLTQRPSGVKLWQHPEKRTSPSFPAFAERDEPDDVQATSYFAASAKISSFVMRSIRTSVRSNLYIIIKHVFDVNKGVI